MKKYKSSDPKKSKLTSIAIAKNEELRMLTTKPTPWLELKPHTNTKKNSSQSYQCQFAQSPTSVSNMNPTSYDENDEEDEDYKEIRLYEDIKKNQIANNSAENCIYTSIELLRIQMLSKPSFARIRDENGNLPLHNAICKQEVNLMVIHELIKAYPNSVCTKDSKGDLPLFIACQQVKVQPGVVKALLQAFPDAATRKIFGSLALHQLVYRPQANIEVLKMLITSYPEGPSVTNSFGRIPLHFVSEDLSSRDPIIELIASYPQGLFNKNRDGKTPLDIAIDTIYCLKDNKRVHWSFLFCKKNLLNKKETLRYMLKIATLCSIEHGNNNDNSSGDDNSNISFILNEDKKTIFKNINFEMRLPAFLIARERGSAGLFGEFLNYFLLACPGIWRNIVEYI